MNDSTLVVDPQTGQPWNIEIRPRPRGNHAFAEAPRQNVCGVCGNAPEHWFHKDEKGTTVSFYDARSNPASFGPLGQFVSSYYLSTLDGTDGYRKDIDAGINLDGGVPSWSVSAPVVAFAISFAKLWERS